MFSPKIFLLLLVFLGQCLATPLLALQPRSAARAHVEAFSPVKRGLSSRQPPAPNPNPPQGQGVRIYAYYICSDPNGGGVAYSSADIQRAMAEAFRRHLDGDLATSSHGNQYPSVFHWQANWVTLNQRVNTNNLIEYPLAQDGTFGPGGDAGPDRVVIDAATGTFGGVYTHRGQPNNRFVPCLGHNADPFAPAANFSPPLFGDLPWMSGFGTGSGLDKRVVPTIDA